VTSARLALDLAERAGDEQGQAFALSTLGDALDSSGQYNKSIEAYEKRIAIAEKLEDVDGHEF
jgi:tetratricopeptide (TPR) repeat protein